MSIKASSAFRSRSAFSAALFWHLSLNSSEENFISFARKRLTSRRVFYPRQKAR